MKLFSCLCFMTNNNSDCINEYNNLTSKDLKKFIPPIQECYCISVYDGDTITVVKKFSINDEEPQYYKYSVRLSGINTPEIRTKDLVEKKYGLLAKDKLTNLILNKIIKLEDISYDKYGRILAKVFISENNDTIDICKKLMDMNLAEPYFGKKKKKTNWELYYNNKIK